MDNRLLFVVFILLGIQSVSVLGIKCFVCNSGDDENCLDPFDKATAKVEKKLKNCDEYSKLEDLRDSNGKPLNFTHCRKLVTTIDDTFRVSRSCATLKPGSNKRVYSATDYYQKMDISCKGDECNAATTTTAPGKAFSLLASFIIFVLIFNDVMN